jgi:corrinoid protein of di/trimethylamine methyltransferase
MSNQEILKRLSDAISNFDEDAAVEAANEVLAAKVDPLEAVETLSAAMKDLGDKFEKMEVFLPEIVLASEALKAAMKVIEPEILKKGEGVKRPVVVIGTVKGDVHTVGKDMVSTLLMTAGFDVVDLGPDTAPSKFLDVAQEKKAAIIAASALMSTTLPVQKDLIDFLEAKGVRKNFKVLVGGGVCTDEWAKRIGADGYGQDAVEGVKVAKQLVEAS